MATPNYLLTPAASLWRTRRVDAGEWKTARKDCPSPSRAVCLFAPQYRLSFNFRFVQRKNPLSEGLSKFKVRVRKSKGALCP